MSTQPIPLVDCDDWLRFIEHELARNSIRVFTLSEQELRRLVDGWKALKGADVADLQRRLDGVTKVLQAKAPT